MFVTKDEEGVPLPAQRKVLDNFPRSQHRPATITVGASIPVTRSLPLPRQNFRKAIWELFAPEIEKTVRRIPVTQDNMMSFNKMILHCDKKFLPRGCRGRYILCWSQQREEILEEYERTGAQEIAYLLLDSLQSERQSRYIGAVEDMDISRSSRKAWNLLRKLDGGPPKFHTSPIDPNSIAKKLNREGYMYKTTNLRGAWGGSAKDYMAPFRRIVRCLPQ